MNAITSLQRRHYRCRCQLADATDLPFDDSSFDLAYTQFALHEKDETVIDGVLREARRVLAPGGHLIVVDYAVGPYRNPLGAVTHRAIALIERFAGAEHFANYRRWIARGGIDQIIPEAGFAEFEAERFYAGPIKMGVYEKAALSDQPIDLDS